jgi:UDP:flavonoid glycosyltransferase YjiC (YdhE family)
MATILVVPFHELGHMLPSLPLAALLRARGHRVVYATILDQARMVEAHGFPCVTVLRDVYPRGHLARLDRCSSEEFGLVQKVTWMRDADELFSGRLVAELEPVAPDLLLIDVINTMYAMAARARGLPCLHYSVLLSQRIAARPPICTETPLDAPAVQRQAIAAAAGCLVKWPWQIYEDALVRFAYPAAGVSFATAFTPELAEVPELLLPPSALDFPGPSDPGDIHVAVPVDTARAEPVPAELERFLDGRPVIYVALGTQAHRYPAAGQLLRAAVLAVAQRPMWQAVVAAGAHAATLAADCPGNVLLLARAPQLWVLRRAAVFVTHAGIGSLREAVELGVPLIAIPQGYDQDGNAARIEYHGIGVHLPVDVVEPARLVACIDRLLADRAAYQARLRRIQQACAGEAAEQRAIRVIEDRLASAERPPALEPALDARAPATGPVERGWLFAPTDPAAGDPEPDPGAHPSLGCAGFTICPDLGHALSRAESSLLVRAEVSGDLRRAGPYVTGRVLRRLWQLDASELLSEFAQRCVEHALDAERAEHPEIAEFFLDAFARCRAGADADLRAALERVAAPRMHRGYGVALEALEALPHDAARLARDALIRFRCQRRVADGPPSAARYLRERAEVIPAIDAELVAAVAAAAARAGLDLA